MTDELMKEGMIEGVSGPAKIFGYAVPLAFLVGGLLMSLQTGAMGAGLAITAFKTPTKWLGRKTGEAGAREIAGPVAGTTAGGISALAKKTEKVPLLKYVTRALEMATVPALTEYAAKQRRIKKPEAWDQMSIDEKERDISGRAMARDQLVLASEMKKEGTLQKSSDAFQEKMVEVANEFRKDARYLKEVIDIFDAFSDKLTKKMKMDLELAPIHPKEIDKETGRLKRDIKREKLESKIQGIVTDFGLTGPEAENQAAAILHAQELKPKDISGVSKGSLKTDTFRLAMRQMKSSNLQALRNSFDAETIKAVLDEGKGLNTINEDELKAIARDNRDLVRWAYRTPAGRETLNWSEKWETLPEPAKRKRIEPGTEEFKKTEKELKEKSIRGRPGVGGSPSGGPSKTTRGSPGVGGGP